MKKSLLCIALASAMASASAQDLTSKKGEPYLPETDDWAIAFEATPFLNFAGNLFNSSASAPTANWLNNTNMAIVGKMFKDEKTAYRAMVRLGFTNNSTTLMTGQAGATAPTFPNLPAMVEDKQKVSQNAIVLGAGMEMRKGKTRLQGYYGADLMITVVGGSKSTYEYGNALSSTNTSATGSSSSFSGANNTTSSDPTFGLDARITEMKTGSTFGVGVRAFIGAEYFVFPKVSVGAEYGWGLGFSSTGASATTYEAFDGGTSSVGTWEVEGGKGSGFGLDTDINEWWGNTGNLFIVLHFGDGAAE